MTRSLSLLFDTADLVEPAQWVSYIVDKDSGFIDVYIKDSTCTFSFATRDAYVQSHGFVSPQGNAVEENDNKVSLRLNADSFSRVIKAIPAKAESVSLDGDFSSAQDFRGFTVRAGKLTTFIPGKEADKKPRRPLTRHVATCYAEPLFSALNSVCAASDKDKETSSALSCVHFAVSHPDNTDNIDNTAHIRLVGTDSYVVSLSKQAIVYESGDNVDNEEDDSTTAQEFLIPARYASMKGFPLNFNGEDTVEVIAGKTKRGALGYKLSNGFVALFSCSSASPVQSAPGLVDMMYKQCRYTYAFSVANMKKAVKNVFALSPDCDKLYVTLSNNSVVVSDEENETSVEVSDSATVHVVGDNGANTANSGDNGDSADTAQDTEVYTLNFTKFVINKMFAALPTRGKFVMAFNPIQKKAVYVTSEENYGVDDKSDVQLVVALAN